MVAYGVCADFERCREVLRGSLLLSGALVRVTGEGSPVVPIPGLGHAPQPADADTASLARRLWETAIAKAVAGPDSRERQKLRANEDLVTEHGQVALVAKWIFEQSLINVYKRNKTQKKAPVYLNQA